MLDGLLGRGFSSKCKGLIKLTKTRIDAIRRKKDATQRIMKKDIADLLANGLDINAYGRSEDFCAGLNGLFCYDFIEQSCEYILKQLSVMQKQRECPEECREAVASLMFAAARFSDLPELRDLRDMFQERFGSSLEYYVNQKFFERSASKPPTMEKKIQLLQDIALEFSIKWDSRGFEQRMAAPTPTPIAQAQPGSCSPFLITDDKYKLSHGKKIVPQTDKPDVISVDRCKIVGDRNRMINGLEDYAPKTKGMEVQFVENREYTGNGHKPITGKEETIPKREIAADKHHSKNGKEDNTLKSRRSGNSSSGRSGTSSSGRKSEVNNGGYRLHIEGVVVPGRGPDHLCHVKPEVSRSSGVPYNNEGKEISSGGYNYGLQLNHGNSTRKLLDKEPEGQKGQNSYSNNSLPPPYIKSNDNIIPPPYVKLNDSKYDADKRDKQSGSGCDEEASLDPSTQPKASVFYRPERSHLKPEYPNHEGNVIGLAKVDRRGHKKDYPHVKYNDCKYGTDKRDKQPGSGFDEEASLDLSTQPKASVFHRQERSHLKPEYPNHEGNVIGPAKVDLHGHNKDYPYVKHNDSKYGADKRDKQSSSDFFDEEASLDASTQPKASVFNRPERNHLERERNNLEREYPNHEGYVIEHAKVDRHGHKKDYPCEYNNVPLPKPRSVRRKHPKASSSREREECCNPEDDAGLVKRSSNSSSSRRRESSRRGIQVLIEDEHHHRKDDEERMMDKLLLHYSKKPTIHEPGMIRGKSRAQPLDQISTDAGGSGGSLQDRNRDEGEPEVVPTPTRSVSLPHEQAASLEVNKVYARANSFQPDNQARHVHPKLPDYDDLAARFAALRGR